MRIVTIVAVGLLMLIAGFGIACKEQQPDKLLTTFERAQLGLISETIN
jgi:hypothetical protein